MPSYHFHAYARVQTHQTHHVSIDRSQLLLGLDSIDCDKSSILKKKFNFFDFSSRFSHDFLHLPPTSTAAEACRWCPRQYQIRCALPIFLANRVFVSHHNFGKYWHGFKSHKRKRCDTKCKIKRHHSRDGDKYKNCVGHGDKWGKVKIHIADNRSTQSFSEMLTSKSLSCPPSRFYIFFFISLTLAAERPVFNKFHQNSCTQQMRTRKLSAASASFELLASMKSNSV